jgi:hypothetical protein
MASADTDAQPDLSLTVARAAELTGEDERLRLYEIYHLLEFWYWVTSSGLGWSLAPVEEQLRVRVIP